MSVSKETCRAMDLLFDALRVVCRMTPDETRWLVNVLHDLMVSVLVDFENERREQGKKP